MRRLLQRLHRFWFDGNGDGNGADDELIAAARLARRVVRRLDMAEDPRVRQEFDEIERDLRALQRKRRQG